jgi:hypothetical protein
MGLFCAACIAVRSPSGSVVTTAVFLELPPPNPPPMTRSSVTNSVRKIFVMQRRMYYFQKYWTAVVDETQWATYANLIIVESFFTVLSVFQGLLWDILHVIRLECNFNFTDCTAPKSILIWSFRYNRREYKSCMENKMQFNEPCCYLC